MSSPASPTSSDQRQAARTGGVTVVPVHGAVADASSRTGVIALLQQRGHTIVAPPDPLRRVAADAPHIAAVLGQIEGTELLIGHSYDGAVITEAPAADGNVRGPAFVAAFAPGEGEVLGAVGSSSKDSALVPRRYPTGQAGQTAARFGIDPAKLHDVFAADPPVREAAVPAATQWPLTEVACTEPPGPPAWRRPPSWAVVATGDEAAGTDVVRSMAQRGGAEIVALGGSRVITVFRPGAVTEVIRTALEAVARSADVPAPRQAQQAAEPVGGRTS